MQEIKKFRFALSTTTNTKPTATTSPFLATWRAWHRSTCPHNGEAAHVWRGQYFNNDAPARLYTDLECLGCGEHYREGAK